MSACVDFAFLTVLRACLSDFGASQYPPGYQADDDRYLPIRSVAP
jgi:hypothetical protein